MTDNKIVVAFQAADFVNARYFNTQDCPVARVCKRTFPDLADTISVGGYSIHDRATNQRLFEIGHVTLDGKIIEDRGFGGFGYETLTEAFAANPETQATITFFKA